jgi:hypothetical protein
MLSRRSFLNTSLGAGFALAGPGAQQAAAQVPRREPRGVSSMLHELVQTHRQKPVMTRYHFFKDAELD